LHAEKTINYKMIGTTIKTQRDSFREKQSLLIFYKSIKVFAGYIVLVKSKSLQNKIKYPKRFVIYIYTKTNIIKCNVPNLSRMVLQLKQKPGVFFQLSSMQN